MRIAQINIVTTGSTGKIMLQIANVARAENHIATTYSSHYFSKYNISEKDLDQHFFFGAQAESVIHYYVGTLFGRNGLYSKRGTNELIKRLKNFNPDIIHLHNLHQFCINLPLLFDYIKKNNIKVIWTLHDCWTFTGHCPHFVMVGCDKWKTECHHCPQPRVYPKMYIDTSKKMYRLKKEMFTGIKDMTIVTPSEWLANLVKQSFLKDYRIEVINNGIDLNIFKPTYSDFKNKYHLENKKILLGVASSWSNKKGLDVFIELSNRLSETYQIVLVGIDATMTSLPSNIVCIRRTTNQTELAKIYTAADLFINPTREDTFPTVNIESLACGTPVLTFETGGSPEIIDETCGSVVATDDINELENEIYRICENSNYSIDACLSKSKKYDMYNKFKEYIKLYENIAHSPECPL